MAHFGITEENKEEILAHQKALAEFLDKQCQTQTPNVRKALSLALLHEAAHGMVNGGCSGTEAVREFCLFLEHAVEQRNEHASEAIMEVIEQIFQSPTPP